jgi:hypothetical protein
MRSFCLPGRCKADCMMCLVDICLIKDISKNICRGVLDGRLNCLREAMTRPWTVSRFRRGIALHCGYLYSKRDSISTCIYSNHFGSIACCNELCRLCGFSSRSEVR